MGIPNHYDSLGVAYFYSIPTSTRDGGSGCYRNKVSTKNETGVTIFLDRACLFQDSKQGRLFCEYSATQLRQLQGVYQNFTSTTSSDDPDDSGQCHIMPKLQELLSVLKEYGNSKYSGKN